MCVCVCLCVCACVRACVRRAASGGHADTLAALARLGARVACCDCQARPGPARPGPARITVIARVGSAARPPPPGRSLCGTSGERGEGVLYSFKLLLNR